MSKEAEELAAEELFKKIKEWGKNSGYTLDKSLIYGDYKFEKSFSSLIEESTDKTLIKCFDKIIEGKDNNNNLTEESRKFTEYFMKAFYEDNNEKDMQGHERFYFNKDFKSDFQQAYKVTGRPTNLLIEELGDLTKESDPAKLNKIIGSIDKYCSKERQGKLSRYPIYQEAKSIVDVRKGEINTNPEFIENKKQIIKSVEIFTKWNATDLNNKLIKALKDDDFDKEKNGAPSLKSQLLKNKTFKQAYKNSSEAYIKAKAVIDKAGPKGQIASFVMGNKKIRQALENSRFKEFVKVGKSYNEAQTAKQAAKEALGLPVKNKKSKGRSR